MSDEVDVFVSVGERNVRAGRLYPHRRGAVESASFVYADTYLADPASYALDPALPLVAARCKLRWAGRCSEPSLTAHPTVGDGG